MTQILSDDTFDIMKYTVYHDDVIVNNVTFNIETSARLVLAGNDIFDDDIVNLSGQLRVRGPTEFNGLTLKGSIVLVNSSVVHETSVTAESGAVIRNLKGAIWNLDNFTGLNANFVNFGLFINTTNNASDEMGIGGAFLNYGTIDVEAGRLWLDSTDAKIGGYVTGQGAFGATSALLQSAKLSVATLFFPNGPLQVSGYTVSSSTLEINQMELLNGKFVNIGDSGADFLYYCTGHGYFVNKADITIVTTFRLNDSFNVVNSGFLTFAPATPNEGYPPNVDAHGDLTIRNLRGATWRNQSPTASPITFLGTSETAVFYNFGNFEAAGAHGVVVSMAINNNGVVRAAPSTAGPTSFTFDDFVRGVGVIEVGADNVTMNSIVGTGQTLQFVSAGSVNPDPRLTLNDVGQFFGSISGFDAYGDDSIFVDTSIWAFQAFAENAAGTAGSLMFSNGESIKSVTLAGAYDPAGFEASASGHSTTITYLAPK